jgi:sugar phosphate isomerase/epimerase
MIRISCHSENFGVAPPDETFAFIKKLGFDYIDVAARSIIPQEKIVEDPEGSAAMMRDLSSRYRLGLSELFLGAVKVGGSELSPSDPETQASTEHERRFRAICDFAARAGFESVMYSAGNENPGAGYERSFDNAAAVLQRYTGIAEERGVMLCVEPSRLSLLNTPEAALEMVRRVPKLRYTLDFLHFQVRGIPQIESMKLIKWAGHVHARQAAVDWGKCPVEFGEIDYDAIIKRMKGLRWNGAIAMEYWCGPEQDSDGVLAVDQNVLMRYEIRRLIKKYGA